MTSKQLLCICGSAGSIQIIKRLFQFLPNKIPYAIIVIIHRQAQHQNILPNLLQKHTTIKVSSPDEGEPIKMNHIYLAPPSYHMQVENDKTISYTIDEPVHFSRPSIDVLLETAAFAYRQDLTVMILSGASADGAKGAKRVTEVSGTVYVLDPTETNFKTMPKTTIQELSNPTICSIDDLVVLIQKLGGIGNEESQDSDCR